MAEEGTFCINADVIRKAGANASATAIAEAYTNAFITDAEAFINSACRYNFTDNYSTLNNDTKKILRQTASDLAAIYCIQYDMSGIPTRTEAENRVNILRDAAMRSISLLRDKKVQDFINGS